MKLAGISEKVFLDRYSLKDQKGNPLEKTPQDMWRRIAKAVSQREKKGNQKRYEKEFFLAMKDFKYVPGGRILAGAGTGFEVTFYNCFVIPSPKDSRGGILETLKRMVEIMARGGGVGINLSSLRPRGSRVRKVNGFSSGPINWAELFSVATKDIIQQGGTRRGALMLMLWDWHPDIEEFITVKQDLARINGANLSVCISDSFMEAVEKDADWPLVFPDTTDAEYDEKWNGDLEEWKKLGKKIVVRKIVKARKIWDLVADAAWKSAEPGVVFMERYNKWNNNWYWNRINCVNPCGEEGLPPWGVCNLGSVNLSAFVKGSNIDKRGKFDFIGLKKVVHAGVRFQDNIIDMDQYFFEGIRETQLEGERRIGLGTMGLGDTLIKLHMRYGSKESLVFIEKVYKIIRDEAYRTSAILAVEKGVFPKFDKDKYTKGRFIQALPKDIRETVAKQGVRNSILLMQAPTGSTSLMANTTSGIEPVFEYEFLRKDRLGEHIMRHHLYEQWYKKHEKEIKDGKVKRPEWFVSAQDLTPEEHVGVQAVIQRYVDASISKTVNAPNNHTVEDVKKLYSLAYKQGLKGIAYMREGSRAGVLERIDKTKKKEEEKPVVPTYTVKPRPMVVHGSTYRINTPVGVAFITLNTNGGTPPEPLEVFINISKPGSDVSAMAEGLGRTISLALRFASHLPALERVREIVNQLQGIGGARTMGFGKDKVRSLPDAVAKVLSMHYNLGSPMDHEQKSKGMIPQPKLISEATQASLIQQPPETKGLYDLCPACGEALLAHEEGCKKCYGCGYSEC
ncbi:ribonucleoside-diphosphate reductase, adenosylcobalamin-dependent [Candidatus Collierbacteria bacterium CG1_02_44_10]|uniref:Vitamin B12-dependent ribonucleotide reductase n=2 Tax=Microgenomates group TaxID=1794810 RepID=A0A2M7QD19_9BACT|nr:MAG: ribonucleoside-diphosphate reductase, adenosylcobalamin-dependent [Candidatus Collierbacteria bacterium CG1_02_44_10]PIY69116.1 MAG: ribonucleoside-diphosphate reductase, adenosylcobalamin-dependent [Candidatus Roizmanbacteria bacterium CG_4_10_14_0_8_um_filter_39_9]